MYSEEEIERVVREVVRRLASSDGHATHQTGDLLVSDQVVAISSVEGQLSGITRLIVLPNAVLTPSVRDKLRNNNVELVRQTTHNQVNIRTVQRKLLVANLGTSDQLLALDGLPCDVRTIHAGSLAETIRTMNPLLTDDTLGVVFTDQPEAAVCLANRDVNVNAFVGHDHANVRRAMTTVGANVIVLPSTSNAFPSTNLLRIFVASPRRTN